MWRSVVDMQMLVDVAPRVGDEEAVELALGAASVQVHAGVVARHTPADKERQGVVAAVARLSHQGQAGMGGGRAIFVELDVGQPRAFAQHDLGHAVVPVGKIGGALVMLHQHRFGACFQHDEMAQMQHGVGLAGVVRDKQRRGFPADGNVQQ